ncbi:hypothetical protein SAMN05421540_10834 [Psychroflexus halocasei]|uniref:Uncharacterized protein n=1 Tax=Psychroflexus halocasei TaxID=908615 RepID=A0A1H4CJ63_9FLAO|nr:hypothetical protein SAMN05421540_10834 [Psychroflexus halocasei]
MNNQFFKNQTFKGFSKEISMRFAFVFLILCSFQMNAENSKLLQSQEVSVYAENSTLSQVFEQIESQTTLRFFL